MSAEALCVVLDMVLDCCYEKLLKGYALLRRDGHGSPDRAVGKVNGYSHPAYFPDSPSARMTASGSWAITVNRIWAARFGRDDLGIVNDSAHEIDFAAHMQKNFA